jgi:hypothetical protein
VLTNKFSDVGVIAALSKEKLCHDAPVFAVVLAKPRNRRRYDRASAQSRSLGRNRGGRLALGFSLVRQSIYCFGNPVQRWSACLGRRRAFPRGEPVEALSRGSRFGLRALDNPMIDVRIDHVPAAARVQGLSDVYQMSRAQRRSTAGSSRIHLLADVFQHARVRHARGIHSGYPQNCFFPCQKSPSGMETRRFPRQLHDRLPLLAAISEGFSRKRSSPSCITSILVGFVDMGTEQKSLGPVPPLPFAPAPLPRRQGPNPSTIHCKACFSRGDDWSLPELHIKQADLWKVKNVRPDHQSVRPSQEAS